MATGNLKGREYCSDGAVKVNHGVYCAIALTLVEGIMGISNTTVLWPRDTLTVLLIPVHDKSGRIGTNETQVNRNGVPALATVLIHVPVIGSILPAGSYGP